MRKHLILAAAAALTIGGNALAEDLSYTYAQAQINVGQLKLPGNTVDGSGLGINGSYGFTDMLFGTAALNSVKYSENGGSLRVSDLSLGVGGHLPLTSSIDFVGVASFERITLKSGGKNSESGWGVSAGVRGAINDKVQWNGGLKYSDIGDAGSAITVNAGGRYYFMPAFSAGAELGYRKFDDSDLKEITLSINARYEFAGM